MVVAIAVALASTSRAAWAAPSDLVALRAGARTVLRGRCMPCHSRASEGAVAKALAAFDLDDAEWSKTLSDERLPRLLGRLQSKATPAELAQVQRFIDAELGARQAASTP
jgi:hypothetical protein